MSGTNKFNGTGGKDVNISNGTADLYGATLGAVNLISSMPVKTNSQKQLISSKLFISDIENLQQKLNHTLTNPYNGLLKVHDLETAEHFSLDVELNQIENITNTNNPSHPFETTIHGNLKVDGSIHTNEITNLSNGVFIHLDSTDINISSSSLTWNENDILTTPLSADLHSYHKITASEFIKNEGLNTEYLMADGSISLGSDLSYLEQAVESLKSKTRNIDETKTNNTKTTFSNIVYTPAISNAGILNTNFAYVNNVNGFGVKLADLQYLLLNPSTIGILGQALLSVGTGSTKWGNVLSNPAVNNLDMNGYNSVNIGVLGHDLDSSLNDLKKKTQGISNTTDSTQMVLSNKVHITNTDNNWAGGVNSFKTDGGAYVVGELYTEGRVLSNIGISTAGYIYGGSDKESLSLADSSFSTAGGAWIQKSLKVIGDAGIRAVKYIIPGGLTSQFLKADGTLDGRSFTSCNATLITPPAPYVNSTIETNIITYTQCSGALSFVVNGIGSSFMSIIKGKVGTDAAGIVLTFRVYGGLFSNILLFDIPLFLPSMPYSPFTLETLFTVRTLGSSGQVVLSSNFMNYSIVGAPQHIMAYKTIDTAVIHNLRISAQWSVASLGHQLSDLMYNLVSY